MSIITKLATNVGRRDEAPNIALAKSIAAQRDVDAVSELVEILQRAHRDLQSDAIKTLYEIGYCVPELLSPHAAVFLLFLQHPFNRLVWGSMRALHVLTPLMPDFIYQHLGEILTAADRSTVVAKDCAAGILTLLVQHAPHKNEASELLLDLIRQSPENQFPTYAENAAAVLSDTFKVALADILQERLPTIGSPTKQKRVAILLKKIKKQ